MTIEKTTTFMQGVKEYFDILVLKISFQFAEKIAKVIGQEHKVLEGKFEGLVNSDIIKHDGKNLLNELHIVKQIIDSTNMFTSDEYQQFIRYLFSKRIITAENFDNVAKIFDGINEQHRILIKS